MQITTRDISTLYKPEYCSLRIYLDSIGTPKSEPDSLEKLIAKYGKQHERNHLHSLGDVMDLREGSLEERYQETCFAVEDKEKIIYQPVLHFKTVLEETEIEIYGEADFFILEGNEYIIRDCKMIKNLKEDNRNIELQITLFAWLFEQNFKTKPFDIQIFTKSNQIESIPYDGGEKSLEALKEIVRMRKYKNAPYSPVGVSKCGNCKFNHHCWTKAQEKHDISLVIGIDQSLAIALRKKGIKTYDEMNDFFTVEKFIGFKKVAKKGIQRVGKKSAESILRNAKALSENTEILIQPPEIPVHENYVMFDLEGIPSNLANEEMIYLWGVQVYGKNKGKFLPTVASFEEDGDKRAWEDFLKNSNKIFQEHGDIPFVHYSHYEKTKLNKYIDRYGDTKGIAERIKNNLLDLYPIAVNSIAIPREAYKLKVIEQHIGFKRTLEEYGGDWAIAKYFEAKENNDEARQKQLIREIIQYNQEDLDSTWEVLKWLLEKKL
ncbi:MAG: TM0106 family RecB-like putative nuclease [Nitrospinota bacterium]|nr:TM0106 family RecB-like putative nuclease [Nitrospinota bacterium]